ncbi:MAG: hypothetical protein V3T53_03685 [Phycisphaerales bacterium]
MVYRTVIAAATVFVGVGILCGCREEPVPRREPPPQTPAPGPGTDSGLLPGPDPAGSGETDGPDDGSADRPGDA